MDARKLNKLRKDLTSFLDDVAGTLGHPRRRRWSDAYFRGLLLDGHRKSVEPMAARLGLRLAGSRKVQTPHTPSLVRPNPSEIRRASITSENPGNY